MSKLLLAFHCKPMVSLYEGAKRPKRGFSMVIGNPVELVLVNFQLFDRWYVEMFSVIEPSTRKVILKQRKDIEE